MVTKKKSTEEEKGRVKVKKLKLNMEIVKELTNSEQKQIQGGLSAVLTWLALQPIADQSTVALRHI